MATAVQCSTGLGGDACERLAGIPVNGGDYRNRVAHGETSTKPGTDQQVALADIGGSRHMVYFKACQRSGALGDGAHTVAVDLHRHGVSRVRDEQHPGRGVGLVGRQAGGLEPELVELSRMGANLRREGATVIVQGVRQLVVAPVMASDLRASAALVLAGLAARGTTRVHRIYHLQRGYDRFFGTIHGAGSFYDPVSLTLENEPIKPESEDFYYTEFALRF